MNKPKVLDFSETDSVDHMLCHNFNFIQKNMKTNILGYYIPQTKNNIFTQFVFSCSLLQVHYQYSLKMICANHRNHSYILPFLVVIYYISSSSKTKNFEIFGCKGESTINPMLIQTNVVMRQDFNALWTNKRYSTDN